MICAALLRKRAIRSASLATLDDGLLKLAPVASANERRTSDPAWCVAARWIGTRYKRVEMPRATWSKDMCRVPLIRR